MKKNNNKITMDFRLLRSFVSFCSTIELLKYNEKDADICYFHLPAIIHECLRINWVQWKS